MNIYRMRDPIVPGPFPVILEQIAELTAKLTRNHQVIGLLWHELDGSPPSLKKTRDVRMLMQGIGHHRAMAVRLIELNAELERLFAEEGMQA